MVALLVGLSVMAVLMGAALPVWSKQAQREREEEYLFRAREYARGVMKWQHKYGASFPPSLDVLVEQRFVRRKYKDPLSGQDFNPVYQTATPAGQLGAGSAGGTSQPGQIAQGTPTTGSGGTATLGQTGGTSSSGQQPAMPGAPVIGVVSKSKREGMKVYNGRTRYDQWAVTYQDIKPGKGLPPDLLQAMNTAPGAAGAGGPGGGPTGQPGQNPFGQPGTSPFGQPGANPMGQPGTNPFGQPGANPFGAPGGPSGPGSFGRPLPPGANPFQPGAGAPGASPFNPAYPPPATQSGQSIFGAPATKKR